MQTILLVIHIFISIGLVGIILMQRTASDGLGLGGGGGNNNLMSGRSSANLLTRMTAVLAALFMLNSLVLAYLASNTEKSSIIDRIGQQQSPKADKPLESNEPSVPLAK